MSPRAGGDAAERRALSLFTKFMRASHAIQTRLRPAITRHGLTGTQFAVLEALYHVGPLNQRELAQKVLVTKGNMTTVVDKLEHDGLVARGAVRGDRRQSQVRLTADGRKRISRIFPHIARAIAEDFSMLTAAEQVEMARLCRTLGQAPES